MIANLNLDLFIDRIASLALVTALFEQSPAFIANASETIPAVSIRQQSYVCKHLFIY